MNFNKCKDILLSFVLLCVCQTVLSQSVTRITGLVDPDVKCDSIGIMIYSDINLMKIEDQILVKFNRSFDFKMPTLSGPCYINLEARGRNSVNLNFYLIEPGDSINFHFSRENVEFTGVGADKCRFRYEEDRRRNAILQNRGRDISLNMYFDYLDTRTRFGLEHLKSYKSKLSPGSYAILKADIIGYSEYKKMQNILISMGRGAIDMSITKLYKSRVSSEPFGLVPNDTLVFSYFYSDYLIQKAFVDQLITNENKYDQKKCYAILNSLYKKLLKDKLIAGLIIYSLENDVLNETLTWCINDFLAFSKSQDYRGLVEYKYRMALNLGRGKHGYEFTLSDTVGSRLSLRDFKGKVIYIDFWASWCGPCRSEMKSAAPFLRKKFKDVDDIVFLYISMDVSEAAWKKAIQQDNIQGIHLISDNGMNGVLAKNFLISAIPRYMILDRDGKIIDNNATRPSDPKTYFTLINCLGNAN